MVVTKCGYFELLKELLPMTLPAEKGTCNNVENLRIESLQ